MHRKELGRDLRLTTRMAVALGLLAATYAGLGIGLVALVAFFPQYALYWILVAAAVVLVTARRYLGAGSSLLRSVGARVVVEEEGTHAQGVLARLAGLAQIPVPALAVADSESANAFAVGLTRGKSVVVVTRGLLHRLDRDELEAVLAHEVAHLANHDAAVLTAVSVPRMFGEALVGGAGAGIGYLWLLVWPLGLLPAGLGTGLTLTVSRYREYAADRGSAVLTGSPEQLMSALAKVSGHAAAIPHDDLRAANAFCIVSTEARRFALFSDHPPLEKRLAALAEIAREMGKPVPS